MPGADEDHDASEDQARRVALRSHSYGAIRMKSRATVHARFTVLFIASLATFVQAFLLVKVACIGVFVISASTSALRSGRLRLYGRLVTFYALLALLAIVWAVVALFNPGTFTPGVVDALRLYVAWSVVFVILFSLIRASRSLDRIHQALVVAAIAIAIINFAALGDLVAGTGFISDRWRRPMELYVGVHEGYVQIATNNIGLLFLIAPYLLAVTLRRDAVVSWPAATRLALVLTLLLAALSGRRALWLIMLATPSIMLLLAAVSGSARYLQRWSIRVLGLLSVGGAVATIALIALPDSLQTHPLLDHVRAAFSATDERSLQKPYLIRAFLEEPYLGSGFGAFAGYTRSEERPWAYELTYHKMLFNLGIVGMACMLGLFASYFGLVVANIRRWPERSAVPWALLVGVSSLFLGAYSNPYFGSFDYLFFVGLLPYLATFTRGFGEITSDRSAGG